MTLGGRCPLSISYSRGTLPSESITANMAFSKFGTYATDRAFALTSEYGTCEAAKSRFWPRISGKSPSNHISAFLFARAQKGAMPRSFSICSR